MLQILQMAHQVSSILFSFTGKPENEYLKCDLGQKTLNKYAGKKDWKWIRQKTVRDDK